MDSNAKRFDLISLGLICLIAVFSFVRFTELPQWVDGYYHLSVAKGFIKSGGWSGWAWWDSAPIGRPHLYPPLYHLTLAALIKMGLSGLNSLRVTEVLILPSVFFFFWYISRCLVNRRFAFFALLVLSSFFPFYSFASAHVPASLAIILGYWRGFLRNGGNL